MSTLKQQNPPRHDWLVPSLEKAIRLSTGGGAIAVMAMAAHASVGETTGQATAPTFTSALQMSIGFCALAFAIYRRKAAVQSEAAPGKPIIK